jgi:phosphonatase-like hydrolase
MPSIKLAVFDMAGTTIHDEFYVAKAFQQAMHRSGYPGVTLQEATDRMGYPKPLAIRELLEIHEPQREAISPSLVDRIHTDFVNGMVDFYAREPGIRPVADAEAVFDALHGLGIRVALDTGFSRDITDVILARVGWTDGRYVDATAASDEVERGRPYPDMIRKIMAELGIDDQATVIKIGDTEVDINEGHQAGCLMTIGVLGGAFTREQMLPHRPTHILNSLSELIPLIKEQVLAAQAL